MWKMANWMKWMKTLNRGQHSPRSKWSVIAQEIIAVNWRTLKITSWQNDINRHLCLYNLHITSRLLGLSCLLATIQHFYYSLMKNRKSNTRFLPSVLCCLYSHLLASHFLSWTFRHILFLFIIRFISHLYLYDKAVHIIVLLPTFL